MGQLLAIAILVVVIFLFDTLREKRCPLLNSWVSHAVELGVAHGLTVCRGTALGMEKVPPPHLGDALHLGLGLGPKTSLFHSPGHVGVVTQGP